MVRLLQNGEKMMKRKKKKLRVMDFGRGEKRFWGRRRTISKNPNSGWKFFLAAFILAT
jgi:hypothetical protein